MLGNGRASFEDAFPLQELPQVRRVRKGPLEPQQRPHQLGAFGRIEQQQRRHLVQAGIRETEQRDNGVWYVAADVITHSERYKKMIIGARGRQIKEIGQAVRKELETVTGSKVFLDLHVEVEEGWQQRFE